MFLSLETTGRIHPSITGVKSCNWRHPSKHTTYIQHCTTLYEGYFHNVVKKTYQQRCYNVEGQRCSATWPQCCRTTLYLCCILHVSFTTLQQRCKTYLNTTSRGQQCLKRKTFFILKHSGIYFHNSTCFKVINNMPWVREYDQYEWYL